MTRKKGVFSRKQTQQNLRFIFRTVQVGSGGGMGTSLISFVKNVNGNCDAPENSCNLS